MNHLQLQGLLIVLQVQGSMINSLLLLLFTTQSLEECSHLNLMLLFQLMMMILINLSSEMHETTVQQFNTVQLYTLCECTYV